MRDKEISEGLGELADIAERDHEVQMARADLYKLAKYAIKLHDMLKGVSEAEGLEGWVQSKITKSADMIGSVYHHMDYENSPLGEVTESEKRWKQTSMSPAEAEKEYGKANVKVKKGGLRNGDDMVEVFVESMNEAKDTHCSDDCCGSDTKAEDCTCPPSCEHCNCNAVNEGEDASSDEEDEFHRKLDKLVHKTFGHSSDEKKKKKDYKESLQDKLSAKLGK